MGRSLYSAATVVAAATYLFSCSCLMGRQAEKAGAVFSKFRAHLVDRLPRGYKVDVADIDRDGKLDLIALATRPACLAWYRNPNWKKHVLSSRAKEYIDIAPYDIDADGRIDLTIAHEFGMRRTDSGGLLHWLRCPQDPSQEWPMYAIDEGHALICADLNADGDDEIIAGYRGKGRSLYIYNIKWYENVGTLCP